MFIAKRDGCLPPTTLNISSHARCTSNQRWPTATQRVQNQSTDNKDVCPLLPCSFMQSERHGPPPGGARRTLLPRSAPKGAGQLFQVHSCSMSREFARTRIPHRRRDARCVRSWDAIIKVPHFLLRSAPDIFQLVPRKWHNANLDRIAKADP